MLSHFFLLLDHADWLNCSESRSGGFTFAELSLSLKIMNVSENERFVWPISTIATLEDLPLQALQLSPLVRWCN